MFVDRSAVAGFILLLGTTCGWSATFTQNNGGLTGSESIINSEGGGDYLTLAEAAADFSSFPGGSKGDYTFYIASDTTETANVAFGNATNGFAVTLRPQGGPRTVALVNPIANSNPVLDGLLIIGTSSVFTTTLIPTDNFTIDGSLPDGTRGLTFTNGTSFFGGLGGARLALINVLGSCENTSVINCNLHLQKTDSTSLSYCVLFTSLVNAGVPAGPQQMLVHDCDMRAPGKFGHGVASHFRTTSYPQSGLQVTSNTIFGTSRGVLLNSNAGGLVEDNIIHVNTGDETGGNAQGVLYVNASGATEYEFNVRRNRITVESTSFEGGAVLGVGAQFSSPKSYNARAEVVNNSISLNLVHEHPGISGMIGIQLSDVFDVARIAHNSIWVQSVTQTPTISSDTNGGIVTSRSTSGVLPTRYRIYNNIVRSDLARVVPLRNAPAVSLWCDGNAYSTTQSAAITRNGSTSYTDLGTWSIETGLDLNSQLSDPRWDWVTTNDLHLAHVPFWMMGGVTDYQTTLAEVSDDIDRDARNPEAPYRGADELPTALTPLPVDLQIETFAPVQVTVGDSYSVQYVIRNTGSIVANDVTVEHETGTMNVTGTPVLSSGTAAARPGGFTYTMGTMAPGAAITITVQAFADVEKSITTTANVQSSSQDLDPSNNSAQSTISIVARDSDPLPDLATAWDGTRVSCNRKGKKCRIHAFVWLENLGGATADSPVRVYLSNDNVPGNDDVLYREVAYPDVAPGNTAMMFFTEKIARTMRGKYLIAVADETQLIEESDEQNNYAAFGPLP